MQDEVIMQIRKPAVAGQFYSGKQERCIKELRDCLKGRDVLTELPREIVAGIVPHAGWMFSGSVAGMVFDAIKDIHENVDTFVIFGAVHYPYGKNAAVYAEGAWETPLGQVEIDTQTAKAIIEKCSHAQANESAHHFEHSIEVQVPFVRHLFPNAKIVPIMMPPAEFAISVGEAAGAVIAAGKDGGKKIVCIGSTDLTHYGPRYGFDPVGTGVQAIKWAKEVNDKAFIDYAVNLNPQKMLITAIQNQNACGAGAAAAAVSAAKSLGKEKGILLAHAHSSDVMEERFGQQSDESVGYAGIIF